MFGGKLPLAADFLTRSRRAGAGSSRRRSTPLLLPYGIEWLDGYAVEIITARGAVRLFPRRSTLRTRAPVRGQHLPFRVEACRRGSAQLEPPATDPPTPTEHYQRATCNTSIARTAANASERAIQAMRMPTPKSSGARRTAICDMAERPGGPSLSAQSSESRTTRRLSLCPTTTVATQSCGQPGTRQITNSRIFRTSILLGPRTERAFNVCSSTITNAPEETGIASNGKRTARAMIATTAILGVKLSHIHGVSSAANQEG